MSERDGLAADEIFQAALELPPEERRGYLERACASSQQAAELAELLDRQAEADRFFDDLSGQMTAAAILEIDTAARPRARFGPWVAEEAVGHGGMGVVYRATRADGDFDQQVAIKVLHLDMHTPELQARFRKERQLLAAFEHRHIARLLDGGVSAEGRPYLVLEYIEGEPITDYCQRCRLSLRDTLRLFLDAVDAVSYLHRNLVVHRDLKPSNLLVRHDGVVKLLDFGVAKTLDDDGGALTRTRGQFLTPEFAAPEQLRGEAVTTATDVYGLGVVLYELLCGVRPFDAATRQDGGARVEPLPSPGARLSSSLQSATRWRRLPRDLDNICLMALRPEPERRYASAEQLGEDIERLLRGLPVRARPSTLGYRASKFVGRHRVGLLIATSIVALVLFGSVRERSLRERAVDEAAKARAVSDFLGRIISSADPSNARGRELALTEVLAAAESEMAAGERFGDQPGVEAAIRLVLGRTYASLGKPEEAKQQLEQALELAGDLDSESETAVDAAEALAVLGYEQEHHREMLLRRVLEIRRREHGERHPSTLRTTRELARFLRARGRFDEAELLGRRVVEISRALFGDTDIETLRAENSLAGVLFNTARYEAAAETYERIASVAAASLGADHPETLRYLSNLGASLSSLGRFEEAEPALRRAVEGRVRVLGTEHESTGMSLHNFGRLLQRLGRWSDSERYLRRAAEARERHGGGGYLLTRSYLADSLRELQRLDEAESIYVDTLARQEAELPDDHPDILRTQSAHAELLFRRGEDEAAWTKASMALDRQLATVGEKRLNAAPTLDLLARIELRRGEVASAVDRWRNALEIRSSMLPQDHPSVLEARRWSALAPSGGRSEDPVAGPDADSSGASE